MDRTENKYSLMLPGLLKFFRKYQLLMLGVLPALIIAGNIATPLAWVVVILAAMYLHNTNRQSTVIFAFLFLVWFGEIRHNEVPLFAFSASTKMVLSATMGVLSFYDILAGRYYLNRIFLFLVPFSMISMISLLNSPIPETSIGKAVSFSLTYFVALHYVMNYTLRDPDFKEDFFHFFFGLLLLCFLIIPVMPSQAFFGISGVRFRGVFGNPNGLGLYSTLFIVYSIFYFRRFGEERMWFKLTCWGLAGLAMVMSGNKGNIGSLFVFLGIFILIDRKTMIWGMLLTAIGFMFLPLLDFDNLNTIIHWLNLQDQIRLESIYTGSGRYDAWRWAVQLWQEEFWLGRGVAYEEWIFHNYLPFEIYLTGHQGGVHNSYLIFLMNNGIIGLVTVMVFFVKFLSEIQERQFAIAISALFFSSIFFEGWASGSLNFFTVMFIFMVVLLINAKYER